MRAIRVARHFFPCCGAIPVLWLPDLRPLVRIRRLHGWICDLVKVRGGGGTVRCAKDFTSLSRVLWWLGGPRGGMG